MKYALRAREIMDVEIQGMQKVRDSLNEEFGRAVEYILDTLKQNGKVVITGMGKNFHIGQKTAATLTSTGTPAVVLHPAEAMHGDMGVLQDQDVLLVFSYSGASDELMTLVPLVKRRDITIISFMGVLDAPLARYSDIIVPVTVDKEACPFNMAPTTSTTATLAVGDALAMVLLEARGFKREDYALLHPGGAIGRSLLLNVQEIMRTQERLAAVNKAALVRDAVLAMTSARAGSAAIVDDDQRVVGVFTDGDLRRHLTETPDMASRPVSEFMTRDPITLTQDHLAVDVLKLFEEHNIDDLVVVDHEGRLAGIVDIQDLPKLKIM